MSHVLLRMIPIPHDDDMSTQNSKGEIAGGLEMREPQKLSES